MYAMSESSAAPRFRSSHSPTSPSPPLPPPSTYDPVRPRRFRSGIGTKRPRTLLGLLKIALPLAISFVLLAFYIWEPHLELVFYNRTWIHSTITPVTPLKGCFENVSPRYNATKWVYGPKEGAVMSGVDMRLGLDCYEFAGTLQSQRRHGEGMDRKWTEEERRRHHTYWRVDLVPFGPRQSYMLNSWFATQHLPTSHLTLWTNGPALLNDPAIQRYLERFPDSFAVRVVDLPRLAQGTDAEPVLARMESQRGRLQDKRAWIDGDLIRLLLLWHYGGVWVDMDMLLTRDLEPLLGHEFVTQWDCYDKIYQKLNGALMHFEQHSPYLCEAFHLMANNPPPRPASTDWGSILYLQLWRRLVHAHIPPFSILPYCYIDGRACRLDNRLPDPFLEDRRDGIWTFGLGVEEGGGLDRVLGMVFGVHLHNQWSKEFPKNGWIERLLLKKHDRVLNGGGAIG